MTTIDTEAVFQAYVECALFTCSIEDELGAKLERPADTSFDRAGYGPDDLATEALDSMRADVADFLEGAPNDALEFWAAEHGDGAIGHDFWLTRNGHGSGFWDRWAGGTRGDAYGQVLAEMARPYGESHVYAGDDELLYVA